MDATTLAVVGIFATVIVAFSTLVVAFQTRRLASATVNLGTQAERQVQEMEATRKLEWAPYLTHQPTGGDRLASDFPTYEAEVTNVGRGPAINCVLVRFIPTDRWFLSGMFEIGYGLSHDLVAPQQIPAMPTFLGDKPEIRTVLFCQDQFGALHMFDPPRPHQVCATDSDMTTWAKWYRDQLAPK